MHPIGMYLAIKDSHREHGLVAADDRRAAFAQVDAKPIVTAEPGSRIGRLAALLRRRVTGTAGA